jgi:succinyl-CoA synthetase beta subunit
VAVEHPEAIHTFPIDAESGMTDDVVDRIVKTLGFANADGAADAKSQMRHLYQLFMEKDATQLEINPLVETTDRKVESLIVSGPVPALNRQKVFCVDAKINFDDNASFRHPVG